MTHKLPSDFQSKQELFDYVVSSVIKQGKPSVDNDKRCVYRGLDNTKCAAGFLIPDDHLATDFRGSWDEVTDRFGDLYSKYNDLIYDLQLAHDYAAMEQMQGYDFVERFEGKAERVADRFGLSKDVLSQLGE